MLAGYYCGVVFIFAMGISGYTYTVILWGLCWEVPEHLRALIVTRLLPNSSPDEVSVKFTDYTNYLRVTHTQHRPLENNRLSLVDVLLQNQVAGNSDWFSIA